MALPVRAFLKISLSGTWAFGHVARGRLGTWHVGVWARGTCARERVGAWARGHVVTWAFMQLGTCSRGHVAPASSSRFAKILLLA